jgi:PhnB protein
MPRWARQWRKAEVLVQLANYLFFTADCEAALSFYAECGLGRVAELVRHGEDGTQVRNEAMRGKVMHARFEGQGVLFYASDNDDAEPMRGSAHMLMTRDREQAMRLFARRAVGGTITTALGQQTGSDCYGKLTDRFGVQWMINCTPE